VRWNIDPVLVRFGDLELRWYGLFFATGLLLSAWKAPKYFEIWGLPKQHAERLTLWVPIGMLLGAHYIHLIFYEWDGLFDLRFEIRRLWPLEVEVGRFWALGSGLASHGGGLGCVLALLLFWFQPRYARKLRPGTTFLLFLTIHFSLRFGAEFFKETQGVDDGWPLNMGHVLSLPIVIVCAGLILFTERFSIRKPLTPEEIAAIEASVARAKEIDAAAQGRAPGNTEPTQAPGAASASGRGSLPRNKKKRQKENAPERREADP